jgi:hypothetical protein
VIKVFVPKKKQLKMLQGVSEEALNKVFDEIDLDGCGELDFVIPVFSSKKLYCNAFLFFSGRVQDRLVLSWD